MPSTELEQTIAASKRVFPLHLTPFENYMVADDRPEYPMTFIVEFEFDGQLDPPAFEAAIDDALQRHPLLRASSNPRN